MSRIEQILEKAEREGNVRFASFAPAPVPASAAPAANAPIVVPQAPQPAPPTRALRDVTLNPRLVASMQHRAAVEQYGALRTRIVQHRAGVAVNVVMVTSPGRGEGKSLTAANLALAIARVPSQSACLLDADLRWPQLQQLFGLPEGPDLNDVLMGHATLEETLITLPDFNLTVLPSRASSSHPAELLGTTAMRRTIDLLRTRYD